MALDAELARLGVTGAVRVAPVGSTVPTDMAPWANPWADLGYISDEGLTEALDEDRENFTPWQSSTPIRTEVTSSVLTFQFTAWESKFETVSLFYRVGAKDMTTSAEGVVSFVQSGKPKKDTRGFGFDVIDDPYARRIICPYSEVTERGDITYKSDTLIGYQMTVTAYPGADGWSVMRQFKEGWTVPEITPAAA